MAYTWLSNDYPRSNQWYHLISPSNYITFVWNIFPYLPYLSRYLTDSIKITHPVYVLLYMNNLFLYFQLLIFISTSILFYIYFFISSYHYLACIYEQKLFLREIVRRKTYINIYKYILHIIIYFYIRKNFYQVLFSKRKFFEFFFNYLK